MRTNALLARGTPPSPLTVLEAHDLEVHGRWLSGWWHRALHIELLQVGHLQAAYGPAGVSLLPHGLPLPPLPLEPAGGRAPIMCTIPNTISTTVAG